RLLHLTRADGPEATLGHAADQQRPDHRVRLRRAAAAAQALVAAALGEQRQRLLRQLDVDHPAHASSRPSRTSSKPSGLCRLTGACRFSLTMSASPRLRVPRAALRTAPATARPTSRTLLQSLPALPPSP